MSSRPGCFVTPIMIPSGPDRGYAMSRENSVDYRL